MFQILVDFVVVVDQLRSLNTKITRVSVARKTGDYHSTPTTDKVTNQVTTFLLKFKSIVSSRERSRREHISEDMFISLYGILSMEADFS